MSKVDAEQAMDTITINDCIRLAAIGYETTLDNGHVSAIEKTVNDGDR